MGRSINRVMLLGNLTRDPELKFTESGTAVCTFGLATNRSWKTKEGKEQEDVQFHRIVAWGKIAEIVGDILYKGRQCYIDGRLNYRQYENKDGETVHVTEIVMDDFIAIGAAKDGASQLEVDREFPDNE